MSRDILQSIIDDFQVDGFSKFFRAKNRSFAPRTEELRQYDDESFRNSLKLGEIDFSKEGQQLVVCVFESLKPLSERSGKKAQYEKGKKVLKQLQADAGIFIFYDGNGNFRFSLIYTNYLGKKRDWSTFRRYTYFVSSKLTNKTFLQQIGDGNFSSLEKIKKAFSVEKVTKDFYKDIANWYFWAVQNSHFPKDAEAEENGRHIAIIRLITRLIFIWFMRERGLVPNNLFDTNKISDYLKDIAPDKSTYYKAVLQNLFFATLSTKKEERQFRSEVRGHKGFNPDFGNQYVYRHHQLFKNPENIKDYFGDIPFLNGGLFECLDDKQKRIYIDGFTSTKKNQPEVPNFLFFSSDKDADLNTEYGTKNKKYKVRGLLDTLSSYNFTIDENDPNDAEIALDPELLGKVFENLLASFNPETASTARKATGSYYTPREIVDYMVTQSLKEYLKTHLKDISAVDTKIDKLFDSEATENPFTDAQSKNIVALIDNLRIVDPAVGSGAFPMGILNKLVFVLGKLDPENRLWKEAQTDAVKKNVSDPALKRKLIGQICEQFKNKNFDYGRKLYLIQKCIYGVDIQQIAVEIAKLRFFIALLVDEQIDKDKDNWGIEPLPNLEFKIMQGNSLISEFMGINLDNGEMQGADGFIFNDDIDDLIGNFEQKKNEYQNEPDSDKKSRLRNEIDDLMISIFETKLKKQKRDYFQKLKLIEDKAAIIPNVTKRDQYIRDEKAKCSRKYSFDIDRFEEQLREFSGKNKTKPFFAWKLYFAEVFQGVNPGFDIVISNPPYVQIQKFSGQQIQSQWERQNYETFSKTGDIYCLFYEKGHQILREGGVLAFITSNKWMRAGYGKKLRQFFIGKTAIEQLIDFGDSPIFSEATTYTNILLFRKSQPSNSSKVWDCSSSYSTEVSLDYMFEDKSQGMPLFSEDGFIILEPELARIKKSIEAIGTPLRDWDISIYRGILTGFNEAFVIDGKKKDELIAADPKSTEIFKPILRGRDIKRYRVDFNDLWLINTHNGYKDIPPINVDDYPAIKAYLDQYWDKLKNRQDKGITPFNLRNCAYLKEFEKEKIVWAEIVFDSAFYFDSSDIYAEATSFVLTGEFTKYLTAMLNSKLLTFAFRTFYAGGDLRGNTFRYKKVFLMKLPVVKPTSSSGAPIEALVDNILEITKAKSYPKNQRTQTQVRENEKRIDQLIYELYDLTPDEIAIVEGELKE